MPAIDWVLVAETRENMIDVGQHPEDVDMILQELIEDGCFDAS